MLLLQPGCEAHRAVSSTVLKACSELSMVAELVMMLLLPVLECPHKALSPPANSSLGGNSNGSP